MKVKTQTDPTLSAIASLMGKRGGKSRSDAKLKAVRNNLKKAFAARGIKPRFS